MKKILIVLMIALLALTGCSTTSSDDKHIEDLQVIFVPSRDAEEIITATEPLKQLIIDEMATHGYTIDKVTITVSPNYEAAGEALSSGTAQVGFIPAGTYVTYQPDGVEVILAATRDGLSKDSENAKDWNDGLPTLGESDNQVTYYRSLIFAGTSAKGQELAAKVNAGGSLTWDDLNSASWCVGSTTSSAGYIYPSLWLSQNYDGKTVADLSNAVSTTGYSDTAQRLATGACDIGTGYADIRRDYEENWKTPITEIVAGGDTYGWGKTDIWTETNVIGVTPGIMNDTISVSNNNDDVTADFKTALAESFIAIAQTEAGAKAIAIYNHISYKVVTDADYDSSREVMKLTQGS